jgi:hypothetical protein
MKYVRFVTSNAEGLSGLSLSATVESDPRPVTSLAYLSADRIGRLVLLGAAAWGLPLCLIAWLS